MKLGRCSATPTTLHQRGCHSFGHDLTWHKFLLCFACERHARRAMDWIGTMVGRKWMCNTRPVQWRSFPKRNSYNGKGVITRLTISLSLTRNHGPLATLENRSSCLFLRKDVLEGSLKFEHHNLCGTLWGGGVYLVADPLRHGGAIFTLPCRMHTRIGHACISHMTVFFSVGVMPNAIAHIFESLTKLASSVKVCFRIGHRWG